jgi:trimethylamine--corrinoid protein Co-methyltransferase
VFSAAGIEELHAAALRVLARTGVLVQDDEAVALLRSRGARCDGRRVFPDEGAVTAALAAAPSSFVLGGRSPERDLTVGGRAVYGTGSGPAFVLGGDGLRRGRLDDAHAAAKLCHLSSVIDFNGDAVEPLDLPEARRTRLSTHARLTLSDKAVEWIASVDDDLDAAVAINEILFGADWRSRPRALIVLNTNSPLQISSETARLLLRWARLGQPSCVTACVMGGTTGPATLAGALVVQHAEVLASLVLAQAAGEGSPFIYGGVSTMSDLRTGAANFGTPEFAHLAEATALLAHHCGLPVRAGAAVTDAHVPDGQAALESARGLSAGAGSDFAFQSAGILSSFNAFSLEKFIMDEELVAGLRAVAEPAATDEDALAEDVIDSVGPAGDYLSQAHTRRHARDLARPTILVREAYEKWQSDGGVDLRAALAREVARRLDEHEPPDDLDPLVRRQLDDYCLA